ncbi:uncharacterized protein EV420DRAFT_335733 [Desarmillaria tabescens]|uniref:Helicase ATP-binding domain-containing protein n=1 Tax=Armillaria tabescens TaxID=1929756 RepID=A0AA39KHB8_ARMTA|nr:uncharacterized protein EV420DRAFT_335733 [Desarmillaria tabescens]KAK0458863.1 hypothetical protein EV420DRAFT_335733 [Desarmillaria tabescens]
MKAHPFTIPKLHDTQSKLYPIAFGNEPILLCVATGTEKTHVTRKITGTNYTDFVRLSLFDEIHLLQDECGPILERIIAWTIRQTNEFVHFMTFTIIVPRIPFSSVIRSLSIVFITSELVSRTRDEFLYSLETGCGCKTLVSATASVESDTNSRLCRNIWA